MVIRHYLLMDILVQKFPIFEDNLTATFEPSKILKNGKKRPSYFTNLYNRTKNGHQKAHRNSSLFVDGQFNETNAHF